MSYDSATGYATCVVAGTYCVEFNCEISQTSVNPVAPVIGLRMNICRNDLEDITFTAPRPTDYMEQLAGFCKGNLVVAAGDTLSFTVYQNTSDDAWVGNFATGAPRNHRYGCSMSIKKIA